MRKIISSAINDGFVRDNERRKIIELTESRMEAGIGGWLINKTQIK
jgi:uncharacterized membrane protein YebE (DUF533 family)